MTYQHWNKISVFASLFIFLQLFYPQLVFAHATHIHANGFIAGIGHPVLGLDHLLAMVSVGIVSARMGGRAIWSVPLNFIVFMLAGALIGGYFPNVPLIEYGIVLSVIILGAVIASGKNRGHIIAMLFVGIFGLFHGYAHGSEMPTMVAPLLYAAGFISGTIGLHLGGVLIALGADKIPQGNTILRVCGAVMSTMGLYFFAQLIS